MTADRRQLSLSPHAGRTLDALIELEGTTGSQVVERAVETRLGLVELASRLPRDDRGRLVRKAILPESAVVPKGAEVFRLYVPLPDEDDEPAEEA